MSVLDVGCGTSALLHRARDAGHVGRLYGLDPDAASLDIARRRSDIEWTIGVAASITWDNEFDVATMTGHAFQVLLTDEDVRTSLGAIHRALVDGGRFAFETRNPVARAWERWTPAHAKDFVDARGRPVRVSHEVVSVVGDLVMLTETTSEPGAGRCAWIVPASASSTSTHSRASSPTRASRSTRSTEIGIDDRSPRTAPRSSPSPGQGHSQLRR